MATDDYSSSEPTEAKPIVEENEDGGVTVKLPPPPEDLPEEVFNLVSHFSRTEEGKKFLAEAVTKVLDDFQEDWDSCEPARTKRLTRWKLLAGDLDPKELNFEYAANAHLPLMLERVLRVVHRLYSEMFPDKDVVFTALPANPMGQERADTITLHQNWQLRKDVADFFKQNRRALMEFIVHGDCVFHSYRDIAGKRNRHEALSFEEVVFPYHFRTSHIDMSDLPRKTRILRRYKHELLDLEEAGVFAGVTEMLAKEKEPGFEAGPDLTLRKRIDKFEGKEKPVSSKAAPYTLYEYHGRCKLPGQKRERPVKIIVSPVCKQVIGLYLREQEDWKDRARFEAQDQEMKMFQGNVEAHKQLETAELQARERLQMPDVPPDEAAGLVTLLDQQKPPPPQPPAWLKEGMQGPDAIRQVPIEEFSHGVCIENLDGSLGLGIGLLLQPFNEAADTVLSQFIDAATLANIKTGLVPWNLEMEPGDTRLVPGSMNRVRGVSPEQMGNAIKIVEFPPANPQMLDVVAMMQESADGVSSAPDVLSGEAGKANETYRGIATRVEQATKQLTVLALNYLEMLSNVVKDDARLNSVFLEDEEVRAVIDPRTLESKELVVGRALYLEDYQVAFTADTRFGGRAAKIAEAQQLLGMFSALPPEVASVIFPPSFLYEAVVRLLKASDAHDMIRYLGPRPPTPTQLPGPPPGMVPPGQPPPGPDQPGAMPGAPPPQQQQPPAAA
jgi:hypothetical protein